MWREQPKNCQQYNGFEESKNPVHAEIYGQFYIILLINPYLGYIKSTAENSEDLNDRYHQHCFVTQIYPFYLRQ